MSDLADGRYYILPATPSGPPALPIALSLWAAGTVLIEIPSIIWPFRAWAVRNTKADTEVKINVYEFPENVPRWKFNRLIEETN
ncbi:hypothetical protein L210DRAFT_3652418 [Boletus edulis BED1]|uniref:Uncharacterized protein n=1 Tax=Boletus edulis BED1 TaxID=1328754 RepID=A0AAD4G838_BOLED|nr:hypothetical protein L210DRAFT_3652418 [Boletus edulis BED1]